MAARQSERRPALPLCIQLSPGLGAGDETHPEEDAERRGTLVQPERIEPDEDGEENGDSGLDVVVHRDDRRPEITLPDGHHQVRNERGANDDVADAAPRTRRKRSIVDLDQRPEIDGHRHDGGEEKHPLHDRYGRILDDGVAERCEVDGVADRRDDAQEIAADAGSLPGAMLADPDEQQSSEAPQSHAARLEPRDGLAQEKHGQNHGEHRNDRGDDRRIDGRSERQPPQKEHLVELDAEDRSEQQQEDVARRDPLPRHEQRHGPKEQTSPDHAIDAQGERTDAPGIGGGDEHAFADGCVEPPDDVGDPQGRMTFQLAAVHVRNDFGRQR